jgi:hypothetical protein
MRQVIVVLCLWLAGAAWSTEIRRYDTRVDLEPDGSARAEATVELKGILPGRLRIPVGFETLEAFQAGPLPGGVAMVPHSSAGISWVEVELPQGVADSATLAFAFRSAGVAFVPKPEPGQKPTLPEGSRLLRHRFTNTHEAPITLYTVTVRFPDGSIAHRIREQLPRIGRKEVVPRVELGRFDGREGARLQFAKMRTGDRTSMELEIVPRQRSIGWLVLLVLAIGYLVAFRDLVARKPAPVD